MPSGRLSCFQPQRAQSTQRHKGIKERKMADAAANGVRGAPALLWHGMHRVTFYTIYMFYMVQNSSIAVFCRALIDF